MATRTASLVRVQTGSGTKRIECETDATIRDVKTKLENLFAYPIHRQILSYSPPSGPSRAVEDSVRLQDLDTRNGFLRLEVIGAPQETQHRSTPTTSNKIDQARASGEATIHAGDKWSTAALEIFRDRGMDDQILKADNHIVNAEADSTANVSTGQIYGYNLREKAEE